MSNVHWEETIRCYVERVGRDYFIRLTGGEHLHHHHIGAVTTAYLADDSENSTTGIQVMTQVIPGHKEDVLSEPMAIEAARLLGSTVTVIAGIHYEQLNKEQIDQVVAAAWHVFRTTLDNYK